MLSVSDPTSTTRIKAALTTELLGLNANEQPGRAIDRLPDWRMHPLVTALQALRGVAPVVAVAVPDA